jgi:hypothetical protein
MADELFDWVYRHKRKSCTRMMYPLFNGMYPRIFSARVMNALGQERLQALFLKVMAAQ